MSNYVVPLNFDVTLYGKLEPFNESLSKCRVRIFYRGLNRNRTYISEDFANQLISSLPYTPIKGIFNEEEEDFEGHGDKNEEGRIYGIVMAEPNFAWEEHLDEDGVKRTYACADVLLYTALYSEAKLIVGSHQSMEINPHTFEGEWKVWEDGLPYYEFKKGSLFGLQILGAATEPCFEGAAFYYNLVKDDLQVLIDYVKQISKKGDEDNMDIETLFRLSDRDKERAIFKALNPDVKEYSDIKYYIEAIYDDYALCLEKETESFIRVYYTKNDETDEITLGAKKKCKIVDVTESEAMALEHIKSAGNGSYEAAVNEYSEKMKSLEDKCSECENSLKTAEEALETEKQNFSNLQAEKENLESQLQEKTVALDEAAQNYAALDAEKVKLESEKNDLINENNELTSFKKGIEKEQKEEILFKYAQHLTDSIIEKLKSSIEDYSVNEFKKEVCTAAVENDVSIFNNGNPSTSYYYTGNTSDSKNMSGIERLLEKHKNGGSK